MYSDDSGSILIAIVDDEQCIRNGLSSLLRSMGHETVLFDSGEALLISHQINNIKFMILDLNLTGMSGVELYQQLRDSGIDIPTVFISGYADPDVIQLLISQSGQLFLPKPIDVDILLKKIDDILSNNS